MFWNPLKVLAVLAAPAALLVAGCGGRVTASSINPAASLAIHSASTHIDTNGSTRYTATLPNGEAAKVEWSVSGGDPAAGAGKISSSGVYTPPNYLTVDTARVSINAVLANEATGSTADFGSDSGTADLTITPGFLQPLTPGNLSVGPGASVTISGSMTEVGGSDGIRFVLAAGSGAAPREEVGGDTAGRLSSPSCVRGSVQGPNPAYTVCTVTYTAPATISAPASYFIVGSVVGLASSGPTLSWTRVLLNPTGVSSNPAAHQAHLAVPVQLGSSSGNNSDYDAARGQLADCCGGTLGALLQDAAGNQFVLSNNHVLARSDQSLPGETVIQPGLIDNGCTPYGVGAGTTPVATLTGYPALNSTTTNVDAAIARVAPGAVDPKGNILELGARQQDGTLAAAPLGISSTGGRGETAFLGMSVAKSGRTTGLTCAAISAIDVDVVVDYYSDCAETAHSMTKTFTNQIAIAGTSFSDAGDSGALVVDSTNAEPVGLFFAGGTDGNGIEHAIANPVGDVLAALNTQVPSQGTLTSYSFVGGTDHPVSCLNYGAAASPAAKAADDLSDSLSPAERQRVETVLVHAQALLNPALGIVRVGVTASKDHPGEGAVAFYMEANASSTNMLAVPAFVDGVSTRLLPANGQPVDSVPALSPAQPRGASLVQALAAKTRAAAALLKGNPAIFGVGIGQSLDNASDAAVVLFVDRKKVGGRLPTAIEGQRIRVTLMDRLHVTRSHSTPVQKRTSCESASGPLSMPFIDSINLLP